MPTIIAMIIMRTIIITMIIVRAIIITMVIGPVIIAIPGLFDRAHCFSLPNARIKSRHCSCG